MILLNNNNNTDHLKKCTKNPDPNDFWFHKSTGICNITCLLTPNSEPQCPTVQIKAGGEQEQTEKQTKSPILQ